MAESAFPHRSSPAFEERLFTELGVLRGEITGTRATLEAHMSLDQARFDAMTRDISKLEDWREKLQEGAEVTGKHEISRLQSELERREDKSQAAIAKRRDMRFDLATRVGILFLGGLITFAGGLTAKAFASPDPAPAVVPIPVPIPQPSASASAPLHP